MIIDFNSLDYAQLTRYVGIGYIENWATNESTTIPGVKPSVTITLEMRQGESLTLDMSPGISIDLEVD